MRLVTPARSPVPAAAEFRFDGKARETSATRVTLPLDEAATGKPRVAFADLTFC